VLNRSNGIKKGLFILSFFRAKRIENSQKLQFVSYYIMANRFLRQILNQTVTRIANCKARLFSEIVFFFLRQFCKISFIIVVLLQNYSYQIGFCLTFKILN